MNISQRVRNRIKGYDPEGKLDQTAWVILALLSVNHGSVKDHVERVALLSEGAAERLSKDTKAAFFAGLLHDVGKLVLPSDLFDGHNISGEEYALVKSHALAGFEALSGLHLFTALCAGIHHGLYHDGYGLTLKDFPSSWNAGTIKKVLEISAIVSICDFVDAFTRRQTTLKHGKQDASLRELLEKQYPDDLQTIKIILDLNQELTS